MIARVSLVKGYLCMQKQKTDAAPESGRVDVTIVKKPWGHERIWARTDRYVGKILHINAGEELSVQYHNEKDETVHLLSGKMNYKVKKGDSLQDMKLRVGESLRIVPGTVHQVVAIT